MSRSDRATEKIILCIDDSQAVLDHEQRILERSGYFVIAVVSARRGLTLATSFRFDAVLLGYHMPEMNGDEVACEIRRLRPATAVVIVSGSEIPEETRRLVDAVVPKDQAARELLPTVSRVCERPYAS